MKIYNNYQNPHINKTYLRQSRATEQKKSASESGKPKEKDEIVLSPQANELRKLEEAAKSIPEVRQEKVEAVKERIESGGIRCRWTVCRQENG